MKKVMLLLLSCLIVLSCSLIASAETYDVVGTGKNGDVHVLVEIEDGKIMSVQLGTHEETPGIFEPPIAVAKLS